MEPCATVCHHMKQINLRLDEGLLARVDRKRELIPRNAWIVRCLETTLDRQPTPPKEKDNGKTQNSGSRR